MKIETTSLKRHTTKILGELRSSREPVLITDHGKPSAYLVNVQDYEHLQIRLALLEAISRGQHDLLEGRVYSHEQATEEMSRWFK
ncbi:MAG TPA: type II toxin-antitoxin system Phd/YefM family antitoxin [Limnobacter sp.]|nr:type II toxin-antitoxin system Phd/YefM family antitoxin [Limnobacter sp.]